MLDFTKVWSKEITYQELCTDLSLDDLANETNEMVDKQLALISSATDADVVFVPEDPDAHDAAASSEGETEMAWTLGHVIVHVTASSEESAFLAAEMARGVAYHGRSRHEVHWTTIKTV